jgi:hypothetical protein
LFLSFVLPHTKTKPKVEEDVEVLLLVGGGNNGTIARFILSAFFLFFLSNSVWPCD